MTLQMSVFDHWHSRFSFTQLGHRLQSMPMLLILIPFITGILFADGYALPLWCAVVTLCLSVVIALWAIPSRVAFGYAFLALMMFGYLVANIRMFEPSVPYDSDLEMEITIQSPLSQREGYSVAQGCIEKWCEDDKWHEVNDKVQLWLRTDTLVYGDRVHIFGRLKERMSKYVGYDELLHRRGYIGGVAISNVNILNIKHDRVGGMQHRALNKLLKYQIDTSSHAVVEAMVIGSRHGMNSKLSEAYSVTGLSHLMAVSGLHLGIVLMVVNVLVLPLSLIHRGHRLGRVIAIVAMWLFAIMSGASPSVVRAAIMLSVLQFATITSSRYNSLNALAATVFAMLVYRTDYLYDISFQLSVLAVVGIVAWGVPLLRYVRVRKYYMRWLLTTVIIGVVATLWTLPIVSITFERIPLIGVVVTPIVLLCAYVIVAMGLFALLLPHPIAQPFAVIAEYAAQTQNSIVEWFATLPYASVEHMMSGGAVVAYYLIFIVITLGLWSINRKKMIPLSYDDSLV